MGGLRRITLFELPTDPSPHPDQCQIYAKDDFGRTELFFMDQSGSTTQITKDGYLDVQYEADVLGLPYELVDPASGVSKGSVYTKKVNEKVELFYIDSVGNVVQITDNGSLKEDAILVDSTYYVDGDAGDDSNSGLTWGTAKKTFSFLYSGDADALPRELKANLTIRSRGTILAKDSSRHTDINGFYGYGQIIIIGETEDIISGQTPTGWDNTTTSVTYHSYLEVSGASYGIDDYRGMFIQFTSPASDTRYPILSNTATKIETINLPDLSGVEQFKIVNNTSVWKGATVADPSTIISFFTGPYTIYNNKVKVSLSNIIYTADLFLNYDCILSVYCDNSSFDPIYYSEYGFALTNSSISTFAPTSYICSITSCYFGKMTGVNVNHSIFTGTGNTSCNVVSSVINGRLDVSNTGFFSFGGGTNSFDTSRIKSNIGISVSYGSNFRINECFFESCVRGILIQDGTVDNFYYANRFKNCTTCIELVSGKLLHKANTAIFYGTENTNDVVISNSPVVVSYTFSDLANKVPIANAKTGSSVVYYHDTSYDYFDLPYEYNNTTSGLVGYSYQAAIDELSLEKAQKNNGVVNPNGTVSGNIGDIYVDTLYDITYINIDGTNTGWRVT